MGYLALVDIKEHGNGVEEEIYHDGTVMWKKNGFLHRIGGPALIRANGELRWFENGQPHRLDGPAQIEPNGNETWFINGGMLIGDDLKSHKEKYTLNKELNLNLPENIEVDKVKKPKI
jgi:hypothetical protein